MAVLTPWVVASRDAAVTGVASINGKQGDVTLEEAGIAASGENKDITSLGGLVGPLRLNAQGVDEYDAVTVGQLNAAVAGGTGGVTASGVVSDFIGAVEWWQGSASNIPSGYVPANGQLLNRADYPDLWSLVKAGVLNSVTQRTYASTDAAWLAEYSSRAFYSYGDGDKDTGTQFRIPDLNGVWNDGVNIPSTPGLFLRGSGVANKTEYGQGAVGVIRQSSAPDITGTTWEVNWLNVIGQSTGAFYCAQLDEGQEIGQQPSSGDRADKLSFAASRSNAVYGRDANTAEVRPNSVTGIWIIRANGNFTSADTDFNVTRSDESLPAAGTTVLTGNVIADYAAAGDTVFNVQLTGKKVMGNTDNDFAQLNINDGEMSKSTTYDFPFTGKPSTVLSSTEAPSSTGITSIAKYFDPRTSTVAPGFYSWSGSPTDPLVANGGWYDYIYLQHGGNGGTNISNYAMLMEISHNGTLAIGQFDATTGTYVTKKQFTSTDLTEALQATVANLTQRLEEMQVVLKAQNEQMLLLQAKFAD